jgi:hypothetical protein
MTGRLDWSALLAMFTLGGYENNAVLSDSTALLALVGLTLMQESRIWIDYTDADDIQESIATAIDEIVNGTPGTGDMIKIAEATASSNCAELSIDNFDAGDWIAYKLIIQGMITNYAALWVDVVELEINDVATNNAYATYGRYFLNGTPINYEHILNYPANLMYWAAAALPATDGIFGFAEVTFYRPKVTQHKVAHYVSSVADSITGKVVYTQGTCGIYIASAINKILIRPANGTLFLAGGDSGSTTLTMTLYGLK